MGDSYEDISDPDAALMAVAKARVGRVLRGKYRIERVLGVGGMAFVYQAVHRNGRRVALKMLHPELSLRPDLRKRFLLEGHAANAVNHSGVVAVIDDDIAEDGSAFVVMELLDGASVEEIWRQAQGRLDVVDVLEIVRQLCDVLQAAHSVGVIHRDIKPANLFITAKGELKVLDFGLARVRDAARGIGQTSSGAVMGTPAFLPPEQAAGHTREIDGQTDLWAVGATMFTLLSGRTVHEGQSAQHLVILSATTPPRSLAAVVPDALASVVALVDRALAFEKRARWPNAGEMHRAICEAIAALRDEPSAPAERAEADTSLEYAKTLDSAKNIAPLDRLVGMRTSQPVSSETRTQPMVRPHFGRRIARALKTALASVPMTTVVWKRRAVLAGLGGLVVAGILVAVVSVIARRSAREPATEWPPAPVLQPGANDDASVRPTASLSASAPLAGTSSSATRIPSAVAPTATATARRGGPRATATPAKPGCSPPTYVDSNGITVFKEECL